MAELTPDDADGLLELADRCSRAAKTARQVTAPAWADPVVSDRIRTAVTYGVPFDAVFAEVHRSNMTKVRPGPPVLNADGKILKGPDYEPPRIAELLRKDGDSG